MTLEEFHNFNLKLLKTEKEQIEEQIKVLQDKLKDIEKNSVENIIKNLVYGDFVEVYYKEPKEEIPEIYMFEEITRSKNSIVIHSHTIRTSWQVTIRSISKIIVRKDIKEAYEKFTSLLKPTL